MSGVVSIIINNSAAMVGLELLKSTCSPLQTLQTANPTTDSVNSAADSDAANAVVPTIRTKMTGLTAPNRLLGNIHRHRSHQHLHPMQSVEATLVDFSSSTLRNEQKAPYVAQISFQDVNMKPLPQEARHIGKALVGGTGDQGTFDCQPVSITSGKAVLSQLVLPDLSPWQIGPDKPRYERS